MNETDIIENAPKKEKNKLKSNLAYQIIYQVFSILVPLITTPYISRILGPTNIGIYSFNFSINKYFCLFVALGISTYGARLVALKSDKQDDLNKSVSSLLILHFIIGIIVLIIYYLYCFLFVKTDTSIAYIIGLISIATLFDISWIYFGLEKFKTTIIRNFIIKVINVLLIFLLVQKETDLVMYTFIMSFGVLLGQGVLWINLKKHITFVKPQKKEILIHIKPLLVLFIPVIAVNLYKYIDKIMLGVYLDKASVGFYEQSEKVTDIPLTIITAFGAVMLPRTTYLFKNNQKELAQKYFRKTILIVAILVFAIAFGITAVAPLFVPLFFGNGYEVCIDILPILSISIIFAGFSNVIRTQVLIPKGKDFQYCMFLIVGALFNFIGNLILIPLIGLYGAVYSTLLVEFLIFIQYAISSNKDSKSVKCLLRVIPFLIFAALMYLLIKLISPFFESEWFDLFVLIMIGGSFYLFLSGVYLLIFERDFVKNLPIINKFNKKLKKNSKLTE